MLVFPTGLSQQIIEHYLKRAHHQRWRERVVGAAGIAIFIWILEGALIGAVGVAWFIVTALSEFLGKREREGMLQRLVTADQAGRDRIVASIFVQVTLIGAIYSVPVVGLAFTDQSGRMLGVILAMSILFNITCQHVLHPRLILMSLPVPAICFLISVAVLAGDHPLIVIFAGLVLVAQTLFLTNVTTKASHALLDARNAAEVEGLARGIAESANETKSNFLANISHELRSPLNAVIGYGEILQENATFEARDNDVKDIEKVLVSARRLLRLVGEILDTSKIEAGGMQLEPVAFDVAEEIQTTLDMVAPAASTNRNKLTTQIDPKLGMAYSDPLRFSQCVLNLLSNALKFTTDGHVTLRANREDGPNGAVIRVSVTDTGIGIAPPQMAFIFQPFTQADPSATRKYGGTGLGLSLSRSLARLMGGDVTVTSELGKGSTFEVTILADLQGIAAKEHV